MADPSHIDAEHDDIPPRLTPLHVTPPLMRVVTTGFFTTREELVPVDELLRQDREEASRRARKRR